MTAPLKLCFFDIDDTLCIKGELWPDNGAALRELHAAGLTLGIATGRSLPMVPPDIGQLLREGILTATVCANGQHNCLDGRELSALALPPAELEALIGLCHKYGLIYQLAGRELVALSEYLPRYDAVASVFPCFTINPNFHREAEIYQFSVHVPLDFDPGPLEAELDRLNFHYVSWHGPGADLIPWRTSKLDGVRTVATALGYGLENVMAFGDGLNDVQLLQGVGLGVAMGNGRDEVKALADYVTLPLDAGGIRAALRHFQLI